MHSDDLNLSAIKSSLYDVAPFSIKDTDALIKKYNLKSNAVRIFYRYNGDEKKIKNFLKEQANTDASLSRASVNSFLSGIHKPSTKSSIAPTKHMDGGNKSRRNTRTYRHSKKHKRVRHTRRKRTRRNHRSRRHR